MEVRNATTRIAISGEDSAGAVQLLDKGAAQRSAGIVPKTAGEGRRCYPTSIIWNGRCRLMRKGGGGGRISKGTISALLDKKVSVLVLADVARIPGADLKRVQDFIASGGMVIRFAGEARHQRHRRSGAGAPARRQAAIWAAP